MIPTLLTTSDSKDEFNDLEQIESDNVELKTTYSCDFSDLLVETSGRYIERYSIFILND